MEQHIYFHTVMLLSHATSPFLVVEFVKYRVTHLNVCFEDVLFGAHAQLIMIVSSVGLSKLMLLDFHEAT